MHHGMFENSGKQFRGTHLGLDLVVAARSGDDDRCSALDSPIECVIGRRVAGMKSDQNVDLVCSEVGYGRRYEVQSVVCPGTGDLIAEFDEVWARFDASHLEIEPHAVAIARGSDKIFVCREGKVAFTRTHIDEVQF